jgi:tetratricopeptide (TPR) repeat protein
VTEAPLDPRRKGGELDRLAALEEERRFLLRSLDDLEREHEVGDVDDGDYETLRDGYTVRAADVLRQIEAGRRRVATRPPRRWGRIVGVTVIVAALAVGIGLVLANYLGERGAGQEMTGRTPGDEARTLLADARIAIGQGDFTLANELYREVDERERARGVDNPEARAYYGWTLALLSRSDPDEARAEAILDAARLALSQAIEMEPTYPDPHCFMAIVEFQFRDDPAAALPHVEVCEASNPPGELSDLIVPFAEEIRAAAG